MCTFCPSSQNFNNAATFYIIFEIFNTSLIDIALVIYYFKATTMMFSQTMYSVNEGDGSVEIGLVLSGPSSTATTVRVFNTDGTATGEYCSILINY